MKKLINIMLLLIVLISLISFSVNAATTDYPETRIAGFDFGRVGDGLRGGLNRIEDFFSGGWQNYEKTVIFVIFFFLFFSAYLIGMKKAMGGELTRAHIVFAFTASFLSAFIIVVSMRFDWVNLEYVAWFLIAVLILFALYSLFSKMFEKHKFLAFLLALLLTALLLWLIWYLMSEGRPLEGLGKVNDWFKDITRRAKVGGGPGKEPEGGGAGVGEGEEKKGWLGMYWWVVLIILLALAGGGIGGKKAWDRWRRGRPSGGGPQATPAGPAAAQGTTRGGIGTTRGAIGDLIGKLSKIIEAKKKIQKFVARLSRDKKELIKEISGIKKLVEEKGVQYFKDEILPKLRDKTSREYKELEDKYRPLTTLFEINMRLTTIYSRLLSIENYIGKNINIIRGYITRLGINAEDTGMINNLLADLETVSRSILSALRVYFKLAEDERLDEERVRGFLIDKNRAETVLTKWGQELESEKDLARVIEKEFDLFKGILKGIVKERSILKDIIGRLEKEKKEKEKRVEEEKREAEKKEEQKEKSTKGEIKPVKVPRFARDEYYMIGSAVCADPKKVGIAKEILDETYKQILSRVDEINSRGLDEIAQKIRIEKNEFKRGKDDYPKRRLTEKNLYRGRNIFEVLRLIGEIYGPLKLHWDEGNVKRIKERIEIVKRLGKKNSVFKKEDYANQKKGEEVFVLPGHASHLYQDILENGDIKKEDKEIGSIEQMKKLDRAWQVWWNMFVLGVWQFDRLIEKISKTNQREGINPKMGDKGDIEKPKKSG